MRGPLLWRPVREELHLLGPVSGDGFRPINLSRESAGHRDLPGRGRWQAVPMGFRTSVARSTLADANESRDWRIFADFAQTLIAAARRLYAREPLAVDLDESLYALDSTTRMVKKIERFEKARLAASTSLFGLPSPPSR